MSETVVAATTTVSDKVWTVEDLEHLPPGYRYEILEGVLYTAPIPGWPHAAIISNLHDLLSPWVRARKLGRVLASRIGLYWNQRNYLNTDLLYLQRSQYPPVGEPPTAATLCVEVISPANLRASRSGREAHFHRAGVEELWYVDYSTRSLEIRRLAGEGYQTTALFRNDESVRSQLFPGLEFPVSALWEDLGEQA